MKIRKIKNTAEKLKNGGRTRQTDNRGLTLIELVITVAIIAIFSGVVMTFIMTGSNTYRSTSSNAKVQMETQELVDRMEDLIIDTNRSLYYANGTGENTGSEIKNDIKQSGDGNSDGNKTFIVCNEYKNNDGNTSQYICDVIDWDKKDATVYYSQREYTATSSSDDSGKNDTETAALSEDEEDVSAFSLDEEDSGEQNVRNVRTKVNRSVLATGILDFRADLTKVESDNIVRFQLSTENGKKEIETLHSVSLRNKVKVKKPADSVDDPEPTDVGIRISYAPASMDPGASDRLAYNLSGNGSIDPSTITWRVVSDGQNGSFPGEDHTNSKLTINENASGSITVKVSAKTSSGKWIESAPVTIQITAKATPAPTEAPEPKELKINPVVNLVANDASYNISDIIGNGVTVLYDDGSTKAPNSVKWELMDAGMLKTYVTLNGNTVLLSERAGDGTGGSFSLKATDTDTNLSCIVDIKVARLELNTPSGIYKVGDKKPLNFSYMEGGADGNLDASKLKLEGKTAIATADASYVPGEKFNADAACDWTLAASYDLSDRGGLGTVKDTTKFTVEQEEPYETKTGQIILADNQIYDTAIARGETYNCSFYGGEVTFTPKWDGSEGPYWNAVAKWYLKGVDDSDKTISLSDTDSQFNAKLTISPECRHGFVLCVDYTQYKGYTKDEIDFKVHAERAFKVTTGITLHMTDMNGNVVQDGDAVKIGDNYKVTVTVDIYDENGNYIPIYATPENGNFLARGILECDEEKTEQTQQLVEADDKQSWIYTPVKAGNRMLEVTLAQLKENTIHNKYNYNFVTTMTVRAK